MKKFVVVEGLHAQDGVVYRKAGIIATDLDLIAMFPNKFKRVLDDTPQTKGEPEKGFPDLIENSF